MAQELSTNQELERSLRRKLDLLLRTGCALMEAQADTSRIMRNMERVEAYLGLPEENIHIYINYNILMVNLSDEEHSFSKFQRVDKHGVNMQVWSEVSKLTWKAINDDYSLEQYEESLEEIRSRKHNYTDWQVAIGSGFACGGFCIQFGCDWPAFFYASFAAILANRLKMFNHHKGANLYINLGWAALVATILAWLTSFISVNPTIAAALPSFMHSDTPWHPLLACALFIVPGVPLINFVNDMLCGYIETGMTRAMNALLMVLAMSFGIALAIEICGINNFVTDLSMTPHHNYLVFAIAAAISAMGFSMIFNMPKRLMWVVAICGIIAVCTRNFVNLGPSTDNVGLDLGLVVGTLAGSSLISILCTRFMHYFHVPHHCLSIPAVIPMVPGVLMYRALFAFIDMHGEVGEVTLGMNNAIKAGIVLLVISLGVAIPNVFVRRMIQPKRKQKLIQMIRDRRIRHGEMVDLSDL